MTVAEPESRFSQPDERCQHPERWTSTDEQSTELEVSALVAAFVTALQPDLAVEVGAASGQTTVRMADAMEQNGHGALYSIEADPHLAERVRVLTSSCQRTHVITADSTGWEPPSQIDLLFIDGQLDRLADFRHFQPWLRRGATVIVHDTAPENEAAPGRPMNAELHAALAACGRAVDLPTPRGLTIIEYQGTHAGVKTYPAGTVAVSADLTARYTQFGMCMQRLRMPAGSKTAWQLGSDVAAQRNRACEELEGDWLWFIDDDHSFPETILMSLLAHEADIVAPVVLRRTKPFRTVACYQDDILDLRGCPPEGLVEVEATGSAGMLIRRRVIEAVEPPWFELGNGVSEDIAFCRKARAAGATIYVDLAVRMGHIATATITPVYDDEHGWVTGFTIADGFQLAAEITVSDNQGGGQDE